AFSFPFSSFNMEALPLPDTLLADLPFRAPQEGFQLVVLRAAHSQFDVEFGLCTGLFRFRIRSLYPPPISLSAFSIPPHIPPSNLLSPFSLNSLNSRSTSRP